MTAREAFARTRKRLEAANIAEPEAKAKILVSHALYCGFAQMYTDAEVSAGAGAQIEAMTARCAAGEPVEYVTGKAYFRYLTLDVSPAVLIPRKETELTAGRAVELIKKYSYGTAADICTGSGCIAVSLATETRARVTASDISDAALVIAARNAKNCGADVEFIKSDMFEKMRGAFDIIVCNPPYVSEDEYAGLDEGVRLYEPKAAFIAGDGVAFYRRIAAEALGHINCGGALVLEIGCSQAEEVTRLLYNSGFAGIDCMKDYEGRDRVITARVE